MARSEKRRPPWERDPKEFRLVGVPCAWGCDVTFTIEGKVEDGVKEVSGEIVCTRCGQLFWFSCPYPIGGQQVEVFASYDD